MFCKETMFYIFVFHKNITINQVYSVSADLQKRDSAVKNIRPFIQFESPFGKHVAVHYTDGSLNELVNFLVDSEPNFPLTYSNIQKKRRDARRRWI